MSVFCPIVVSKRSQRNFLVYELNYDVTNEINYQKISVMEYFLYSSSIFRKIVTLFYLVTGRKWDGGGKNIKKGNSS